MGNPDLSSALASSRIDARDVNEYLKSNKALKLLAAKRLDGDETFWKAVEAVLLQVDWPTLATFDPARLHDLLGILSTSCFRTNGLIESGFDHFAYPDLVSLTRFARSPDARFGMDIVRVIELGDAEAGNRVYERLDESQNWVLSPRSSSEGRERLLDVLLRRFGEDHEAAMRFLAKHPSQGTFLGTGARVIAKRANIQLHSHLPLSQFAGATSMRTWLEVAHALSPGLAREMALTWSKESFLYKSYHTVFYALPWESRQEVLAKGEFVLGLRQGDLGMTVTGKREADGRIKGNPRIAMKQHASSAKAEADLRKRLEEKAKKLGAPVQPFCADFGVADVDAWFRKHIELEGVVELVARGEALRRGSPTLLHEATRVPNGELMRLLLQQGFDPNALDEGGCTPLDTVVSIEGESLAVARQLIAAGGKLGEARQGLLRAAREGYHPLVSLFVQTGIKEATDTRSGKSAHALALEGRHFRTAEALASFCEPMRV